MAGQAFWCPVAYVEQSLFDLLGKVAGKPAGELMGGVIRRAIPVYLSGSVRTTTAEQEVEIYARAMQATGAKAVKFKIGGRMSRNADAYPGRTERMLTLARKTLGHDAVIYTDANARICRWHFLRSPVRGRSSGKPSGLRTRSACRSPPASRTQAFGGSNG
jgi:L-alanine-DL-glutamate epimerase-like enolase superfamily enzyme